MSRSCDVSVVVVNCNGAADLGDCLDSLIAADPPPQEIIVVDNGSADDSVEVAKRRSDHFEELKIVELDENLGLNVARNVGIENSSAEVVAFIDNDAVAKIDFIARGLEVMNELDVDALQCKLMLGATSGLIDSLGYLVGPFGFPRHIVRPGMVDPEEVSQPRYLFGAKGAGMMFRRKLLVELGGFDPTFFLYGDETELFWRIFRTGRSVALAPQSIIFHNSGGTKRFLSAAADELLYRGGTRNYIRMVAKNQHPRRVVVDVLGQVVVWSAVAGYQAARCRFRPAGLIMRGVGEGLKELPSIHRSRVADKLPFRVVPKSLRARLSLSYLGEIRRAI